MATAIPPIDIRLIDSPNSHMKKNVRDDGQRQRAGGDEREPPVAQEQEQDETARPAPIRIASRTLAIAL